MMRNGMLSLGLVAGLIWLGACAQERSAGTSTDEQGKETHSGMITVDGSSTVFPITEAVAEEFQGAHPGARVTVGISGTGGGFKKFCNGETDISDASRPIKQSEIELCREKGVEWIEIPVAYDGIAIVVHSDNDWAGSITVAELKTLWEPAAQRKITRWNQVRPSWPNEEIHLFGPGVDSGTFDYFTEAIVGEEAASRGDFTASEDDNVLVQGVATDRNALGFFGYAYYEENQGRLKLVGVHPAEGEPAIQPSPETIANGTYQPLSRPIFIYVRTDALEKGQVAAFIDFYLDNAPQLTREVGYIALPGRAYDLARERVDRRVTGSMFEGGSQVGVSIEALMAQEVSDADPAGGEAPADTAAQTN